MKRIYAILFCSIWTITVGSEAAAHETLRAVQDKSTQAISIFRNDEEKPILTQNARPDFRPYLHPIEAPDGKGTLTEYSPGHHKHQTGLYWGFTRVNVMSVTLLEKYGSVPLAKPARTDCIRVGHC